MLGYKRVKADVEAMHDDFAASRVMRDKLNLFNDVQIYSAQAQNDDSS